MTEYQISASSDDRAYYSFWMGTTRVWHGNPAGEPANTSYMFRDVLIPARAVVTVAKLCIYPTLIHGNANKVDIYGDDSESPEPPEDRLELVSKIRTANSVGWDGVFEVLIWIESPSIVDIIQELVNKYDYSNKGDIQILVNGDRSASNNCVYVMAYDYDPLLAAKLIVEYETSPPPPRIFRGSDVKGKMIVGMM